MTTSRSHVIQDGSWNEVSAMTAKLLPVIARKKIAGDIPVNAGSSYFYEVKSGWETDILRKADDVYIARMPADIESAFEDWKIKTILIPFDASVTKAIAIRICKRHSRGKTVFYEVRERV